MERRTWRIPLMVGAASGAVVGLLGLAIGYAMDRPVLGGDGPVVRSALLIAISTFIGGTVGMLIGQALSSRRQTGDRGRTSGSG